MIKNVYFLETVAQDNYVILPQFKSLNSFSHTNITLIYSYFFPKGEGWSLKWYITIFHQNWHIQFKLLMLKVDDNMRKGRYKLQSQPVYFSDQF